MHAVQPFSVASTLLAQNAVLAVMLKQPPQDIYIFGTDLSYPVFRLVQSPVGYGSRRRRRNGG